MPASKKNNNMRRKTNKKRKLKPIYRRSRRCGRLRQSGGIKLADKFTDRIGSKTQTNLKSDLIAGETCTIYKNGNSAGIQCKANTGRRQSTAIRAISGEFVGNKFTGHGIFDWINDPYYQRYEGAWVNNKIHGDGIMKWTDGKVFTGRFENDKPIRGNVTYDVEGVLSYKGELHLDESEIGRKIKIGISPEPLWDGIAVIGYNGDIFKGTPHGKGTVFFVDESYEGDINEGTMHGHGKYTDADAGIYEGDFQNNKKYGRGIYTVCYDIDPSEPEPDEIIDGNWENGMLHGIIYEWFKETDKVIKSVYVEGRLIQTKEVNSESDLTEVLEAISYVTNSTIKFRLQEFLDIIRGIDREREIINEAAAIQMGHISKHSSKNPDTGSTPILTPPRRGLMKKQAYALYKYYGMGPKPSPVSSPDVSPRSSPTTP